MIKLGKFLGHAVGSACALYACVELTRWVLWYTTHSGYVIPQRPLSYFWWELIVLFCGLCWTLAMFLTTLHFMAGAKKVVKIVRRRKWDGYIG